MLQFEKIPKYLHLMPILPVENRKTAANAPHFSSVGSKSANRALSATHGI
jgi:hypothetical protein